MVIGESTAAVFWDIDGGAEMRRIEVEIPSGVPTELDPDSWQSSACLAAGRNLTRAEWTQYVGTDEPYRPMCREWPGPD